MIIVIQRVSHAKVEVEAQCVGQINQGLLILCGFEPTDTEETLDKMLQKILNFRLFGDKNDKMNLSLMDVNGGLLLVPQFTLPAETNKGLRPSFSSAAPPEQGQALFDRLVQKAQLKYSPTECGQFGANMQVHLLNDGPVTFIMHF